MTCIIGVVENGNVHMAGDCAGSSEWETRKLAFPKVFRNGELLIGVCGLPQAIHVVRYNFAPEPQPGGDDDMKYIVNVVAGGIRSVLRVAEIIPATMTDEMPAITFLVGYRGHLYEIDHSFQVVEWSDGFNAIGSGREYALGVLYALPPMSPRARIDTAMSAAAPFSPSVQLPLAFEVLETGVQLSQKESDR